MLLYFDLDQFKVVNDSCGHAAGDDLLIQLSSTLSELFEPKNIFARLGGDEFAVLLQDYDFEQGLQLAEELRAKTQAFRYSYQGRSFIIAASIGLVSITEANENPERIMTSADEACYAAKDAGRNRVHVYQENDDELSQRRGEMSWVPRIHEALASSNLVLFAQVIEPTKLSLAADPNNLHPPSLPHTLKF